MRGTTGKIVFRNADQLCLWKNEITGQLSDGAWENSSPHDHWENWCRATASVTTDGKVGIDFRPMRSGYGLNSKELLDIIGSRMIVMVRLARVFGIKSAQDFEGMFDDKCKFCGIPKWMNSSESSYCVGQRAKIAEYELDDIKFVGELETYTMKDLRKDLGDMKAIMKTRL